MFTPMELLKRKRSPSPNYDPIRPSEATDSMGRPLISDSMSHLIRKPGFRPEDLCGSVASEWRELVIRTMFPSTTLTDVPFAVSTIPNTFIPEDRKQRKMLFRPSFTKNLKLEDGRK
jgi:hypothetical protein